MSSAPTSKKCYDFVSVEVRDEKDKVFGSLRSGNLTDKFTLTITLTKNGKSLSFQAPISSFFTET